MVLPGEEIKSSKKRQKRPEQPIGSAAKKWAATEAREAQASQARLNALKDSKAGRLNSNDEHNSDHDSLPDPGYAHMQHAELHDVEDPDSNNPNPANRKEYYRSVTYQERTLKTEASWQRVIPAMFLDFMKLGHKTHQWGDENNWNEDFNVACQCPTWKKKEVEVDAIDLTSKHLIQIVHHGY